MRFYSKPQFFGVRAEASNIGHGAARLYTLAMFQEDFPQFFTHGTEDTPPVSIAPLSMVEEFIRQANLVIQHSKWLDSWRYAAGLYVAHNLTLYLRTWSEGSETPAQAAASGALLGVVKSAQLGDSSVTYDTSAVTAATQDWGDLNATQYGQMLATKARLIGMGDSYII